MTQLQVKNTSIHFKIAFNIALKRTYERTTKQKT